MIFLALGIITLTISLIVMSFAKTEDIGACQQRAIVAYLLGIVGAYIISGSIMWHGIHSHPTAMDVYQGKTTLEITYKDSIPIDSVVVFKLK